MPHSLSYDEADHDARRARQWLAGQARGEGFARPRLLELGTAMTALAAAATEREPVAVAPQPVGADPGAAGPGSRPAAGAGGDPSGIVKPLPPGLFDRHDTNAEMRWAAMAGQGYVVPTDRFFVRNHTRTPRIDAGTWRLSLFGDGLRGAPTRDRPVEFGYDDLRRLPAERVTALVECAGNGRRFFAGQQGRPTPGVAWGLGGVGVAHWRGVRLAEVLRRAGLTGAAVDVMPEGLDPEYVTGGVNLGRVRRPLPVGKALDDVLLAYEMNGEPLPADHGHPVRVVVPGWIGVSSIKWVGPVEVSATALFSPWNTQLYRMFGPGYPAGGATLGAQSVKSAFELPWDARVPAGAEVLLRGRSWSGAGPIRSVQVHTGDGGWRPAELVDADAGGPWQRWTARWRPTGPGPVTLRARATDATGVGQPAQARHNVLGYLFDGVVRHPVTVC
ncbi:molybdopterin-dependent oxidoreductase [Micromonospora carbonacea]|uniref:Molybdopterin-dependent oxidoreductase n=1 Tax=Micromonospora carbonacea TaxID=47853 RepID=A0A7H8XJN6_9ACTN|nr:molybdopterin-dependent oxidoreductase [Micromonospora carbonacea]MBB5826950.1 DMSO/TMAO reductase YedYZ molybdopterin-dependent catalytic subunit [Micromonospora carbonacea]QLD25216.1 molybdopterin-dependent oxidoreductase [Micromonospora carbonacea]